MRHTLFLSFLLSKVVAVPLGSGNGLGNFNTDGGNHGNNLGNNNGPAVNFVENFNGYNGQNGPGWNNTQKPYNVVPNYGGWNQSFDWTQFGNQLRENIINSIRTGPAYTGSTSLQSRSTTESVRTTRRLSGNSNPPNSIYTAGYGSVNGSRAGNVYSWNAKEFLKDLRKRLKSKSYRYIPALALPEIKYGESSSQNSLNNGQNNVGGVNGQNNTGTNNGNNNKGGTNGNNNSGSSNGNNNIGGFSGNGNGGTGNGNNNIGGVNGNGNGGSGNGNNNFGGFNGNGNGGSGNGNNNNGGFSGNGNGGSQRVDWSRQSSILENTMRPNAPSNNGLNPNNNNANANDFNSLLNRYWTQPSSAMVANAGRAPWDWRHSVSTRAS